MTFEEYQEEHLQGQSGEFIRLVRMGWNARGSYGNQQGILDGSDSSQEILDDSGDMRAAFERDYSEDGKWPKAVERNKAGDYKFVGASAAWETWQRAWAARKDHVAEAGKMAPNMLPIAQRKIEQMGGEVMGVVVRNEAGALAAVTDMGRVTWLDDAVAGPVGDGAQGCGAGDRGRCTCVLVGQKRQIRMGYRHEHPARREGAG